MSLRLARLYFALQGAAVLLWWLALWLRPEFRAPFAIRDAPHSALLAFAPPDLVLLAAGSLALGLAPAHRWASPLAWIVAGATLYATLYTLATTVGRATHWVGFGLMAPAALLSLLAAASFYRAVRRDLPPRRSGES